MAILEKHSQKCLSTSIKVRKSIEMAFKSSSIEVVQSILKKVKKDDFKIGLNIPNINEYGTMVYKKGPKDIELFRFLLSNGLDPNKLDKCGKSIIHLILADFGACEIFNTDLCNLLLLYE